MTPVNVISEKATRIRSEILVAGFFQDDRPLYGLAAEIDWIHNGIVSRLILRNKIRGAFGEATLLAAQRKLHAPKILIVGLGKRGELTARTLQDLYARIDRILLQLQINDGVVELFSPSDGATPGTGGVEAAVRNLGTDPNRRRMIHLLVSDEEKAQRIQQQVLHLTGKA
ncbi:MAG: hypothetical protein HY204_05325 [Nitrospirae bacterium]|nr:hypothetical protein [Nitrospirota bacterium]